MTQTSDYKEATPILGGAWGGRPLYRDDAFEALIDDIFGERLRAGDDEIGTMIWSALANVDWFHVDGESRRYSFRAAGDLVAAVRGRDDYCYWYCSGPDGVVAPEIAEALAPHGWSSRPEPASNTLAGLLGNSEMVK